MPSFVVSRVHADGTRVPFATVQAEEFGEAAQLAFNMYGSPVSLRRYADVSVADALTVQDREARADALAKDREQVAEFRRFQQRRGQR